MVGFDNQIETVKKEIDKEIVQLKDGKKEIYDETKLLSIKKELELMAKIRDYKKFMPSFTRQIVDEWNLDSKLGDNLLMVVNLYKLLT